MLAQAPALGVRRIGLLRIGAGLGGLPWVDVRALLKRLGGETDLELVVFERFEAHDVPVPRLAAGSAPPARWPDQSVPLKRNSISAGSLNSNTH